MNGKRVKLLQRQAEADSKEPSGYGSIHVKTVLDEKGKKVKIYTRVCTGTRADYKRLKKEYKAGVAQG